MLVIKQWQREQSLRRTWDRRPDLLMKADLSVEDQYLLAKFAREDSERRITQQNSKSV